MAYSRAGIPRSVEMVEFGVFLVSGASAFVRVGPQMFDFEGGPMFEIGEDFYDFGAIAAISHNREHSVGSVQSVLVSVDFSEVGLRKIHEGGY